MLELLYLVPKEQSLEEAKYLMEGLMTLRSKLLQTLLEQCQSIKVKRCFALKGGAAINIFIRDLPRYSIDIHLTYILTDKRD